MAKQLYDSLGVSDASLHLRDLLELKQIAGGTPSEAYVWPKLIRRLNEMILACQLRQSDQLSGVCINVTLKDGEE